MSRKTNRRRNPNNSRGVRKTDQGADNVGVSTTVTAATWSAPIPPPVVIQQYEEILPGSADRILKMAEGQAGHRIELERTVVSGDSKRSYIGLFLGFFLSMMVIGGGIYLIANGHEWAGSGLIGLNLVGLASVFVYGSRSRRAEREQKSERMWHRS